MWILLQVIAVIVNLVTLAATAKQVNYSSVKMLLISLNWIGQLLFLKLSFLQILKAHFWRLYFTLYR